MDANICYCVVRTGKRILRQADAEITSSQAKVQSLHSQLQAHVAEANEVLSRNSGEQHAVSLKRLQSTQAQLEKEVEKEERLRSRGSGAISALNLADPLTQLKTAPAATMAASNLASPPRQRRRTAPSTIITTEDPHEPSAYIGPIPSRIQVTFQSSCQ
ncbi:hypothetical protein FRC02_004312 [Tulasnella sp. 418]|nr:hypothetical protein FRC02_004312 [Tulasnella sp. 418]